MKKNNRIVDLRSDTVTRPTEEMRRAMAEAEVGDDVYGEDPTVNNLQDEVAQLLGKEAALFVPSGVMANQIAIKCHTSPGDEIIVERESHIFNYETAAPALVSSVQMNTIIGKRGILTAEQILEAIRPLAYYMPRTKLICLENTHNMAGGVIYPLAEIKRIRPIALKRGIMMHLDGARIWNAWVSSGIHPREYADQFDSVSVCFSKGLGAPVGSVVAGSTDLISQARKYRKVLGGGMRQSGIIAAGALYALRHNVEKLKIDHDNAKKLAEGLSSIRGINVDPDKVETNIVIMDLSASGLPAGKILQMLSAERILLSPVNERSIRAVTHMDIDHRDIERTLEVFRKLFKT